MGIIFISIVFIPTFFLPQKITLIGGKIMGFWASFCLKFFLSTKLIIKGRENFPEVGIDKSIPLAVNGIAIEFFFVNLGNPHAVCLVDDINDYPLSEIGEALQTHNFFPDGVNLGFAKINSRKSLDLRVFERGVGETLACGSGACAAAVIGNNAGLLDSEVLVKFQEGSLNINYEKHSGKLVASGSADYLSKLSLEI